MPTTVVLGAGVIGLASAHALVALAPAHRVHLVDPAPELFASASGKAAGFLARDWFAPATQPLGALSFDLHAALARDHNGAARWGYAPSVSYSLDHAYQSESDTSDADNVSAANSSTRSWPQATEEPAAHGVRSRPALNSLTSDSSDTPTITDVRSTTGLNWLMDGSSRRSSADSSRSRPPPDAIPPWLNARPEALEVLSDSQSTAQLYVVSVFRALLAAGVTLHQPARATRVVEEAGVTHVRIEYPTAEGGTQTVDIPCESVVIAAGCWSPQVYGTLFPNASRMPRVTHLAGYSLTLASKRWMPPPPPPDPSATPQEEGPAGPPSVPSSDDGDTTAEISTPLPPRTCHAIFTDADGFAPEIFSRATGDIWVGGLNPPMLPLPALPTDAVIEAGEIARLEAIARELCGEDFEVRNAALCFRPVTGTGRPVIARVHEADLGDGPKPRGLPSADGDGVAGGVYVATGHGPWGITLSLGTGRVLAEMVLGRETSVDVGMLSRW
ncbi:nucleotide-binding domain-containing protein [Epithele typhae]|uniref:nucleotide-binding domain-containing protein n=1 Tax=Epithele typhae TaxID=378194 RepID=UPI0020081D48|nr:nucleotide-binding domain-containing protein [Epithele typhae]KAH9943248.1 nucleotide-binding domain-containing protein [Epithele typhae]